MWNPVRLAGPVFEFELLTTARRGRYFAVRAGYASLLLVGLWQMFLVWEAAFGRELTPTLASQFALTTFAGLAVGQELLVLALTPALVAGVIASEKQRKTLHYVLASDLGGFEVVAGKLLARMLHVAVFVAVGFPVASLLVLLGGVDPKLVLLGTAVAASTAFFLGALSVLVSVYARQSREALFLAYAAELLWLATPEVLQWGPPAHWVRAQEWLLPVAEAWGASSPVSVAVQFTRRMFGGGPSPAALLLTMVDWQVALGLVFAGLAGWRLRPVFRAQDGSPKRSAWERLGARGSVRWLRRRPIGANPVLWKERHTSRKTRLARLAGAVLLLALGVPMTYWGVSLGLSAYDELTLYPTSAPGWLVSQHRYFFRAYLQGVVPCVFLLGLLKVAGSAAASVTSEHEDDTWLSLTATDLTAREVMLCKARGALEGGGKFLGVMLLLTAAGVYVRALHPLSLALVAVEAVVFGAFAAAFGTWVSVLLKSTWRAQFLTVAGLLLFGMLGQTVLNLSTTYAPMVWPGFTPLHIGQALVDTGFPHSFTQELRSFKGFRVEWLGRSDFWDTALAGLSVLIYGAGAVGLAWAACRGFDRAAGRPRRSPRRAV